MPRWLNLRTENKRQKTRQLWGRELNIVKNGLDEEQVSSFVNDLIAEHKASLGSLSKKAKADAEQIAAGIKTKAEKEATRIVDQAKQKEAEDIVSESNRKAGAKQRAVPPLKTPAPTKNEIEFGIPGTKQTRESPQLQEAAAASEWVKAASERLEPHPPEEEAGKKNEPDLLGLDSNDLYAGEVELIIAKSADPKMMSKLFNYVQTTPDVKLVHTLGTWERGTTMTIVLDKPIPLVALISSKIPEVEVTAELAEKDSSDKGTPSALLGKKEKEGRKENQDSSKESVTPSVTGNCRGNTESRAYLLHYLEGRIWSHQKKESGRT